MSQLFTHLKKDETTVFSQAFILKFSDSVGVDWRTLGRWLNIGENYLDMIDKDNSKSDEKAYSMLTKWLQISCNPTLDKLITALKEMKRMDLIRKVDEFTKTSNSPEISCGFCANKDLSKLSAELKQYYLKHYGKISELQPLLKAPANVDLMNKFVDLCIVDAAKPQMDAVFSVERKEFLKKQMRYTPIPYNELFMNKKSVILVSGIAGIGKTWLLRKCLLDWSNDLIWKNVELVFYLECRRINQYENIFSINDLLSVFYKDIISNFNISIHTTLFIIDGLDEFKFFNELSNPELKCNYPIVNVLAEIQNYKHLVAGRVYAIDQYQSLYTDRSDKLTIQIMGFNENGITNYVESHVMEENKEIVKATFKESPIAKAMASVPFYLSSMCKIISNSKTINKNSFLTMTDLYANIFLYFLQKHIIKNNKMIYQIMENDSNKKYILNICKIAFELLVENKVIFSKEEFQTFVSGFDSNEGNFFGFIEKIETNLGCYYQFAHLTIMEFCASVYAYNCLSSDEIMTNQKLRSCLSMICGLSNASQNSLLKFLVNLNPSKRSSEKSILLYSILDRLSKSIKYSYDDFNFFYECFYESQSSFTDEIKSIVDEQNKRLETFGWVISIVDGKTSYATSCDNYFVNYYIKSGRKLKWLRVNKNILSDEEKNLLIRCSTNVRDVTFYRPINFEGWKPKDKIEKLWIWISDYLITKKDFEENFLPWINLCEKFLILQLHDDIDFFKDICEWIRCSNIKKFEIRYRGKKFRNLDELTL
ncbi:NACHT, LRR and PYD domains-containing protein 6-like isoform X2 [Hydra vulgaris]|nr:NACHT, LRR and PYD domains-containing protein 6-like isoform X2 [Hydra vulgaris]XP_047131367.1 NACHT, LRR and PYD domains-containing protein 6-like isoform X2 [Hydra vulgaris]